MVACFRMIKIQNNPLFCIHFYQKHQKNDLSLRAEKSAYLKKIYINGFEMWYCWIA